MCGIFCSIHENNEENCKAYKKCCPLLTARGPDHTGYHEVSIDEKVKALFAGSVLWTQGDTLFKQPAIDSSGNILLWNGDIYGGINVGVSSDTEALLELFKTLGVVDTLTKVRGPYSFVYFDQSSNELWFGRDPLGRISLLWSTSTSSLILSSVASPSLTLQELPPLGIFILKLDSFKLSVKPWSHQSGRTYTLSSHHVLFEEPIMYTLLAHLDNEDILKIPETSDLILFNEFQDSSGNVATMYNRLLSDENSSSSIVNKLLTLLDDAVRLRCVIHPPFCHFCKPSLIAPCEHPKLAVLFSGGLDSTILALLADKHVPSHEAIDLYNVAFEKASPGGLFSAPDRLTGLSSLAELQQLCPNRKWNFVQIDVSREELDIKRDSYIGKLIYPLDSILDDSLGCALWFAASGKGKVDGLYYSSPATVVLLGMGADEMFGGYRKARKAFMNEGWPSLTAELVSGLINLPLRNLGRDNRVVSDHSRVPRFPFLSETVVSYTYSLRSWQKCYLGRELPEGVGDKLILRLLAWHLGLRSAALLPKRALQFGSRVANSKEIGISISHKLHQSWGLQIPTT